MLSKLIRIDDDSRVAEVRRVAMALALDEAVPDERAGVVGIVATEIAGNLRKHAKAGEVHVSRTSPHSEPGIEILAVDHGPGMIDIDRCLADGYSTSGTPGTGLGAVVRASDEFDIYSQAGKGTVLVSRIFRTRPSGPRRWTFGGVLAPAPGEDACGDAWSVRRDDQSVCLLVADGLGHGIYASDAAQSAVAAFRRIGQSGPVNAVEAVHRALKSTRGAAVAVAELDGGGRVRYSGIGNIAGVIVGGAKMQYMVSHNGTAGLAARRVQEFEYTIGAGASVIMHSDGLATSWSLDSYPGLVRRHPSVLAGLLYRDASRGRDDVCVVAVKNEW